MNTHVSKKIIGIAIESDVVIRHFIDSGVFKSLLRHYDLYFIFPKHSKRVVTNLNDLDLPNVHTIDINEHRLSQLRRYCRMISIRNLRARSGEDYKAMRDILRWLFRWPPGTYYLLVLLTSRMLFPMFRRYKEKKLGSNVELESIISKLGIDIIIHPTVLEGLFVNDLISIGKAKNIPVMLLMNSWDNPSSKALMTGHPDRLLVWGEQTKVHSMKYLGIPENNIVVIGAAQFEAYRKPSLVTLQDYRNGIGVGTEQILVCYAGSSKSLNEMRHLQILDEAISKNNEYRVHIVYRPHPWKDPHKDETSFVEYEFDNVTMDPYSADNYEQILAGKARASGNLVQYAHTNTVLRSIDAVISPLSTILLEAAMFGLPVAVYLSDDDLGDNVKSTNWYLPSKTSHLSAASRRTQYTEFFESLNPIVCHHENELWPTTEKIVAQARNKEFQYEMKQRTNFFISWTNKTYSERLIDVIRDLE
jgi:hypothetical protein